MSIPFSGTYTADDLMRLDAAARKAMGSGSRYTGAGCFGAGAIVVLILAIVQWTKGNQAGAVEWFLVFIVFAVTAPMQWWSARRALGRNPTVGQAISGEIGDDSFRIRTPATFVPPRSLPQRASWFGRACQADRPASPSASARSASSAGSF